ncbi:hydrogenase 2 large subunit, partial [Proteus mirabilis]|nr:hydrogenase 2 large subunit [Proteus mirabilis]
WLVCGLAGKHEGTVKHYKEVNQIYTKLNGQTLVTEQLESNWGRIIGRTVHDCVLQYSLNFLWKSLVDNICL